MNPQAKEQHVACARMDKPLKNVPRTDNRKLANSQLLSWGLGGQFLTPQPPGSVEEHIMKPHSNLQQVACERMAKPLKTEPRTDMCGRQDRATPQLGGSRVSLTSLLGTSDFKGSPLEESLRKSISVTEHIMNPHANEQQVARDRP